MDYKEKYLKGLEEAKKTLDSLDEHYRCHELTKDDIRGIYSRLFPELAESDEERIRKELIFFLKEEIPQCSIKEHADKLKAFVSYLENQKPSFRQIHDSVMWDSGLRTGIELKKQKEHQAVDTSVNFEKAEKEKKDFVTSEFIQCIKKVNGFNEGEAYWLEYIGDDTYVGRSDNVLNSIFNITPKELFTHFRRLNDFGVKCGVWKIIPLFKVGDFIKKKGGNYAPWKITEVNEEGGYYCGNYQHGYPTELMFRDQRDYERVDNPGMGVPKINGKPVSTENNVVELTVDDGKQ